MFGIDEDERNVSTGVVELKLSVLDLPLQPFSGWLYLQDQNKARGPACTPEPNPRGASNSLHTPLEQKTQGTGRKMVSPPLPSSNL